MSPRFATALVCTHEFSAWGHSYAVGEMVPEEHTQTWPEGTLATRLQGGFVKYATVVADQSVEDGDDASDVRKHPELLEDMTKKDIVAAVDEALGHDSGLDPDKLNRADLLIAAKTLLAQ